MSILTAAMRIHIRSRRKAAISEVLSDVIMILGSVGLAVIIFFWSLGYSSQSETQFGQGSQLSNQRIQEQVGIDQVKFVSGGASIIIYVRNFGDLPFTVDQVFVNGVSFTPSSPLLVRAREAQPLTISATWTSSRTYTIRITTQRGNIFESNFQAP